MIYKRILEYGRDIKAEKGICRCINQGCPGCPMDRLVTESTKTKKKMQRIFTRLLCYLQ